MVAALKHGRNSIGVELGTDYCRLAASRLMNESSSLFGNARVQIELKPHVAMEAVAALLETGPEYKAIRIPGVRRSVAKKRQPTKQKAS